MLKSEIITDKFDISFNWFRSLRDQICKKFEQMEQEAAIRYNYNEPGKFQREIWERPGGGGGEISLMRGKIFEKLGVNISKVHGKFSENFRTEMPGAESNSDFAATGISVIAHMMSPHIPAIHMNTRFISTGKNWFGGVIDLNPAIIIEEDKEDFHKRLKNMCDSHDEAYYQKYKEECDKYFYISHRKKDRGVGGIFVDYLQGKSWDDDFKFIQDIGKLLLEYFPILVTKYLDKGWTEEEKEIQLKYRSNYAEFNLLYDRGTRFGLMTEGNIEAILMSMPPIAKW